MGKGEKMVPLKKTNSVITLLGDFCFFFFSGSGSLVLYYVFVRDQRGCEKSSGLEIRVLVCLAVLLGVKNVTSLGHSFHLCNVRGLVPVTFGFPFSVCLF